MDVGHAARAVRKYAAAVRQPLLDVIVEMADAYRQIEGMTWEDDSEREKALEDARTTPALSWTGRSS